MKTFLHFFWILFSMMMCSEIVNSTDPFSPCESEYTDDYGLTVYCDGVVAETVRKVFQQVKTPVFIDELVLTPNTQQYKIISNIIGSHTIGSIYMDCPIRKTTPLIVDQNAFNSSKLVTRNLYIDNCDFKQVDWSFLRGFSMLSTISMQFSSNLHTTFHTLPTSTLKNLKNVYLLSVMGLNGFSNASLNFPPPPPNGLVDFQVRSSYDANDDAFQNILNKWVVPTSRQTLTTLKIYENTLTKIPIAVSRLNALTQAWFFGNAITLNLQPGAFNLTGSVQLLGLAGAKITSIVPGVFSGNFKDALVFMSNNRLTTLRSGAFLHMLQQMDSSSGFLDVSFNPLDCSPSNICNMAWLIRDNPTLLDSAWSARCSNGTFLYELNAKNLRDGANRLCK